MKFTFIVANWKSHKTSLDAVEWYKKIDEAFLNSDDLRNKEVVVCPPFPLITPLHQHILQRSSEQLKKVHLGSQDISAFDEGAYTGEVSGRVLQEFCTYSIIGHSERRKYFGETDSILAKKVIIANNYNITPIYCVQGKETVIPLGVSIVAFEPVSAIGSGNPDSPENAEYVAKSIKEQHGVKYVLYGGSVTQENVSSFTKMDHIDGVLVGGASLEAKNFMNIINNA